MIKNVAEAVLDFVYPPHCQGCSKDDAWFCDDCRTRVLDSNRKDDVPSGFASFYHLGNYADPVLRNLIRAIKYKRATVTADSLKAILEEFVSRHTLLQTLLNSRDLVVYYVPADEIRVRARGIDHGRFLANILTELNPDLRVSGGLIKKRQILANATLPSNEARRGNTKDAFCLAERASLKCLLFDDVYTTGATFSACRDALRQAGAREIHGFVLARG